jgi:hypothetical protein
MIQSRQEYPYPRNLKSLDDIEKYLKKLHEALSAGQSALPEVIDTELGKDLTPATLTATGGFGCNSKTAQTAYVSGGAITDTADSTYSANEVTMLGNMKTLLNNIRTALVNCGIMS